MLKKNIFLFLSINIFSQNIDLEQLKQSENIYLEVEFESGVSKIKSSHSKTNFFGLKSNSLTNNDKIIYFKNYLEMLDFLDKNGFETIQNFTNESGRTNNFLLKRKSFLAKN